MKTPSFGPALVFVGFLATGVLAGDWPTWRGPDSNGKAPPDAKPPLHWSETENLLWKVALPAPGNSSPIVWGERVFLTSANAEGSSRGMICFDRRSGKQLWEKHVIHSEAELTHETNPFCAASPTTDGKRIYVSYGSAGMAAYDLEGKELWRKNLGPFTHLWGNATSPVLYGDTVILLCGPGLAVKLVALDKTDGDLAWETPLPSAQSKDEKEFKGSWTTPFPLMNGARDELLCPLPQHLASFDPATGQEIWRCGGLSDLCYTNVLVGNGMIVAMSGYNGPSIGLRVPKPDESGDITESHRLWRVEKNQQRIGSGLISGDHLYIQNEPGVAQCIELKTGKEIWNERVGRSTWSSMTLVDERLYVTDQSGTTHVLKPGTTFERLAENKLGQNEITRATPAFSNGQVFLRTHENLYCFGEKVD
jgi:outer membrane protein assembly factor BamB